MEAEIDADVCGYISRAALGAMEYVRFRGDVAVSEAYDLANGRADLPQFAADHCRWVRARLTGLMR